MEFRQNADVEVLKLHVPSNTKRANFTHFTVYTRSVLVEQNLGSFENAGRFGGLFFWFNLELGRWKVGKLKENIGGNCMHLWLLVNRNHVYRNSIKFRCLDKNPVLRLHVKVNGCDVTLERFPRLVEFKTIKKYPILRP